MAEATITEEQVLAALKNVYDPEIGVNVVDLGLVYDTKIEDGSVEVTMTLTYMGCPLGPQVKFLVEEGLKSLPGVKNVELNLVWEPPWDPSMMSEDAKYELGML